MKHLKWLAFPPLFLWGLFYHISPSEFWPITISKTWLDWSHFENSVLQKPLLTLFLALFHILPLDDVSHLWAVKAAFAALGSLSLLLFSGFVTDNRRDFFLALLLLLLSPFVSLDFFRIRSDQLAGLFFTLFLIFSHRNKMRPALAVLLLIPLAGVKEIFFLVPGSLIFFSTFKNNLNKKYLLFASASLLAVAVWVLALNAAAVSYFFSATENMSFPSPELKTFLSHGILFLLASAASIAFIFLKKLTDLYKYALSSVFFLIFLLAMPQTYSFYLASLAPFAFLPVFLLLFRPEAHLKIRLASMCLLILYPAILLFRGPLFYDSNQQQFKFVKTVSTLLNAKALNYLDGEGLLPRQKFVPCFVSPFDELSNINCSKRLESAEADAVITTNRLSFLGPHIFGIIEENYEQIRPNLWIKKQKADPEIMSLKDLSPGQPIPILIF